jgi:class 3 adenylate cyclase
VAVQARYGVRYVKYWMNEARGKVSCLCTAPDAEAANRVHREAHGLVAERIIEVEPDLAEGMLGGGAVATTGAALGPSGTLDPGVRTLLFTDIVGSTELTQRLGDRAALDLADLHDRLVGDALVW